MLIQFDSLVSGFKACRSRAQKRMLKYKGDNKKDDGAKLEELAEKLARKRKKLDTENESQLSQKRLRNRKKSWSFTKDVKREKKSPSDDESQKIKESDGPSVCNPQLYGKNYGEQMILLKNGIYCTKKAFDYAVDNSRNSATSFLRRIMDGVFKPTAILKCTYSGRPPNAQGPERQSAKFEALDRDAKKAVMEFCEDYASTKGWSKASPAKMRKAMSQWVGEKKRQMNKKIDKCLQFY